MRARTASRSAFRGFAPTTAGDFLRVLLPLPLLLLLPAMEGGAFVLQTMRADSTPSIAPILPSSSGATTPSVSIRV